MCSYDALWCIAICGKLKWFFSWIKLQFCCFVCLQESQVRQTDRYLDVTHAAPPDKAISIEVSKAMYSYYMLAWVTYIHNYTYVIISVFWCRWTCNVSKWYFVIRAEKFVPVFETNTCGYDDVLVPRKSDT